MRILYANLPNIIIRLDLYSDIVCRQENKTVIVVDHFKSVVALRENINLAFSRAHQKLYHTFKILN